MSGFDSDVERYRSLLNSPVADEAMFRRRAREKLDALAAVLEPALRTRRITFEVESTAPDNMPALVFTYRADAAAIADVRWAEDGYSFAANVESILEIAGLALPDGPPEDHDPEDPFVPAHDEAEILNAMDAAEEVDMFHCGPITAPEVFAEVVRDLLAKLVAVYEVNFRP
jgi:hypothetical protein